MRLFVYGTLLEGSGTPWAQWLLSRLRTERRGSVPGQLFAIMTSDGCFPALVRGKPGERVTGSLCELNLAPGDLDRLDRYEGREYLRAPTRVLALRGTRPPRSSAAQAYRWRTRLPANALPVVGGDFLAWLELTGSRAYTPRSNPGPQDAQ